MPLHFYDIVSVDHIKEFVVSVFDNSSDKQQLVFVGVGGAVAAAFAAAVVLYPSRVELCDIDGDDSKQSVGYISETSVFKTNKLNNDQSVEKHSLCRVSPYSLEEGVDYSFSGGSVVIEGDVPKGTSVTVHDGLIVVNGDIHDGSEVSAKLPEIWHSESYMSICYSSGGAGVNVGSGIRAYPCTKNKDVFGGYKYSDNNYAAVTVLGKVLDGASIYSNRGVYISDYNKDSETGVKISFSNYSTEKNVGTDFDVPDL